ncbi:MAG: ATP-dependent DNA helicase RecG [Candidatus Omnitrophota bacterium]
MQERLDNDIQYLKGVGPRRVKILNRLGIYTVRDLLYFFPRRHEDRSKFTRIADLVSNEYHTVKGTVRAMGVRRTYKGFTIFELMITDNGTLTAIWFNQPYLKDQFIKGQEVVIYGKIETIPNLHINNPEYEILSDIKKDTIHTGRIVPVYPLTEYLTQKSIRSILWGVLNKFSADIIDYLPQAIKKEYRLSDLFSAINTLHFPKNLSDLEKARTRIVFDDFFILQVVLARRKYDLKVETAGIAHNNIVNLSLTLKKNLPFSLTKSQEKVIEEIFSDMTSPQPMHRLLQGDVGSGKTIVAVFAVLLAIDNGYQAAIMAPTEMLALQHANTLASFLEPLGLNIALVVGRTKVGLKKKLYAQIESGQVQIIIGTHALLEEKLKFRNLSLIVIDEQHKFGVAQRLKLKTKGNNPDVMVMTATPIPRTLAMTAYGDLDVSKISELPPNRVPVKTYWITEKKRAGLYNFLRQRLNEKKQIYVVYPLIEASEKIDLKDATQMYENFKNGIFKNFNIGLVYGRQPKNDREKIMSDFHQGKIDILVATTVVEVGIDVPNAAIMLIEHAERFGLSQLHQLRGRVGRGSEESYCILLSDAKTKEAVQRLSAMVNTLDGFKIAEVDLKIRGPGELLGTRQHGFPEFKLADIIKDANILKIARTEAFKLVAADLNLSHRSNQLLKKVIQQTYPRGFELSKTG